VAGFAYLDKSDDPTTPVGIGGVTFVIGADLGNSGAWTLSWTDQPGAPNLPLMFDFAVGQFGGGNGSGYLFENVLLSNSPTTGSGSYDINFLNSGARADFGAPAARGQSVGNALLQSPLYRNRQPCIARRRPCWTPASRAASARMRVSTSPCSGGACCLC
jgi:hypothetical protein